MDATHKAQVIDNEKKLLLAMKTNNVELLDQLLHDELLFNGPSGVLITALTQAVVTAL